MTDAPLTPIFLLSLPRSGSTLVQRILAAHEGIATVSEPWLLLPWLGPLRATLPDAGAWHPGICDALEDFTAALPRGVEDYRDAVHDAALRLYARAAPPEARFFVDKTPPYVMIIDEIAHTFPEARLVFLWRNPLSVVSSVIETFAAGRWRPNDYPMSLFSGLVSLIDGYRRHHSRAFGVRYEDLLTGDPAIWRALCGYCGFTFDPSALDRFADVALGGRMGDPPDSRPTGLSQNSVEKWTRSLSSPVRKEWCRRYLRWLGPERLSTMGYDFDVLLPALNALPDRGGLPALDLFDSITSLTRAGLKARLGGRGATPSGWRAVLGA